MALFKPREWTFTEKALDLITTNPFDPSWSEKGHALLGPPPQGVPKVIVWYPGVELWGPRSVYYEELDQQIMGMAEGLCQRLREGVTAGEEELGRYELLSLYCLYCQHGKAIDEFIDAAARGREKWSGEGRAPQGKKPPAGMWEKFRKDYEKWYGADVLTSPRFGKPEHVFACFFTFRRAFYHIFFNIVGSSEAISKLRSRVWESIVTHDFLAWMRGLHRRMQDFPTLITGPSGSGKERVAEAIGRSLYIPFEKGAFVTDFAEAFRPVNLAALSPQLLESELFGHVKGAFSGAVGDRVGRLEECPKQGAVCLDELGELDVSIQVKLLRVLQTRRFQAVGANEDKEFRGKIIAATNRDLVAAMRAGRFREDFYYRLCADQIETPSLRAQMDGRPEDLLDFVGFVCRSVVGEDRAVESAREVVGWIEQKLPGYAWPGNFRELEQCVRSYTIRKEYHPPRPGRTGADGGPARPPRDAVAEACETLATAVLGLKTTCADASELKKRRTLDRIKRRLFTLVRSGTRTMREAAALLGCDVRTLEAGMRAPDRRPADG